MSGTQVEHYCEEHWNTTQQCTAEEESMKQTSDVKQGRMQKTEGLWMRINIGSACGGDLQSDQRNIAGTAGCAPAGLFRSATEGTSEYLSL